jgi:hypothetical protein
LITSQIVDAGAQQINMEHQEKVRKKEDAIQKELEHPHRSIFNDYPDKGD